MYMKINTHLKTHLRHTSHKSHVNIFECTQRPDLGESVCVQAGPNDVDSSLRTVLRLAHCFSIFGD